jgi:hypothetical protein
VAITHQDLIAVLDTKDMRVLRTLSVSRPEGIGTSPTALSVTRDGRRLLVADSGEDAVAVFSLPNQGSDFTRRGRASAARRRAEAILTRDALRDIGRSESAAEEAAELLGERAEEAAKKKPVVRKPEAWELIGRIPVASYPTGVWATPGSKKLVWLSGKGLGVGPNPRGPAPTNPLDDDNHHSLFQ